MFAKKIEAYETRTQLQQALDRDAVPTQPQEIGVDATSAFRPEVDPSAPIFRRTAPRPKMFQVDLLAGRSRA